MLLTNMRQLPLSDLGGLTMQVPGWPFASPAAAVSEKQPAPMPAAPSSGGAAAEAPGRPAELSPAAAALERCIGAAAAAVAQQAARLDAADSRVGDGDCGSTLKLAADAIQEVDPNSAAGSRTSASYVDTLPF